MDGHVRTRAVIALIAGAAIPGCGASDDKPNNPDTRTTARPALKRAILPTCPTPDFTKPRITELRPSIWSLQYTRTKPPPRTTPGASTTVVVVEYPPGTPPATKLGPGAHRQTIAGRRVAYNDPSSKSPFYTAHWKTKRARYTIIANGTHPAALRRFITCLP